MTIRTQLDLNIAINKAYSLDFLKTKVLESSTQRYLFSPFAGGFPAAVAFPGVVTGLRPDNTTAGFPSFANYGGNTNYILSIQAYIEDTSSLANSTDGSIVLNLIDVLWYSSEMVTTVTTDTSLGSTLAVNRPDSTGANTELWALHWTALGVGVSTLTVKYTNQAGTTGQTATWNKTLGSQAGQMARLTLATGDTGIRSVQSYSWSSSLGSGNLGLAIIRNICQIHITGGGQAIYDWYHLGMPVFNDSAALGFIISNPVSNAGTVYGKILIGNG